jgi:geranylgeranyl diphosphate synthase type I
MDRDEFRRNVKTVHALMGEPMAIIAGDALFTKVFEAVTANAERIGLDAKRVTELLKMVSKASFEICQGQALDILLEGRGDVGEEEYMNMISKKTGALMEVSAKIGAILGKGRPKQVQALASYGRLIGMAFQMRDDTLGVMGSERKLGKPVGSDIRQGKCTLVVIRALVKASHEDKAKLLNVLGNRGSSEAQLREAIDVLKRTDAIEYVIRKAEEFVTEARSKLEELPSSEAREALSELASFVIKREF